MIAETMPPKLIFVYNADSGVFNLLSDAVHKILSPQTYACHLCAITHSNFGMRKEWKAFLETLQPPPSFLHADEFERRHNFEFALPAVFTEENGELTVKATAAQIKKCRSVGDLINLLQNHPIKNR